MKKVYRCKCGCGEKLSERVIIMAQSRGKEPSYVDPTHRKRQNMRDYRATLKP